MYPLWRSHQPLEGRCILACNDALLLDLIRDSELLLFDFDGVLADSEPFYRESWNRALEPWNHIIDEEEYWLHWSSLGEGLEGEIRRHSLRHVDAEKALSNQKRIFEEFCLEGMIPLFPGVGKLLLILISLEEQGRMKLAIASNTSAELVRVVLTKNGAPVPLIVGGDGLRKKPFPDIFLRAASLMGVSPASTLVFEDARKGIIAADRGGFRSVFVENSRNRTMKAGGLCRIPGIGHLLHILAIPTVEG
jgi:beta-phosphoglucomutase-like phosphatase (HAD superfamily)